MKDLLAVIAKGLVDDPDSVSVEADAPNEEGTVVYHIHVAENDMGRIITIEEHNVIGGLGDAVCDVVSAECPVKVTKIGVNDRFGYSGPALELLDKFGLTQPHIAKVVRDVVKEGR